MNEQDKSRLPRIVQGLLMMLALIPLTACANVGGFGETEQTICRELERDLPSYSTQDTAETLAAGARFIAVFDAVCQ